MKKVIKLVAALVVLSVALIVSAQAQSDLTSNTNYAGVWSAKTSTAFRVSAVTNVVLKTVSFPLNVTNATLTLQRATITDTNGTAFSAVTNVTITLERQTAATVVTNVTLQTQTLPRPETYVP